LRATQKKVDKHSNCVTIIYVETTWSQKLDGFDPHSQLILDLDTVSWPMNMQGKVLIYSQVFGTICLYMGVEKLLNVKLYWARWIRAQVLGPPNLQHYVVGRVSCRRHVPSFNLCNLKMLSSIALLHIINKIQKVHWLLNECRDNCKCLWNLG
jgi:hypothetical protein